MNLVSRWTALRRRSDQLFRDHEIFVRTGGEVRFLRVSARSQKRAAMLAGGALAAWGAVTVGMVGWQAYSGWQQQDIARREQAVVQAEARVARTETRVEHVATDLDARQDYLEALFRTHFGDNPAAVAPAAANADAAAPATADGDELSQLQAIGSRQRELVQRMTLAVAERAERAEEALRQVGIAPRAAARGGQGGPFIPYRAAARVPVPQDAAIRTLTEELARMEALEEMVLALPSIQPAQVMRLSSGFGYRRDPFNGGAAMHAGLDFTGAHGSPIHAAARGRISFVGVKSGYGNVVEVDHGHGIMTRYAHLSGFAARPGQTVAAGQTIARMGNTGRSTGTHLHFEVRVGGVAVNPRRFLEAASDVLEIQADAGERTRTRGATS